MIRVLLPAHLRTLAGVGDEIQLAVPAPVTIPSVLVALETRYPMLLGTLRDAWDAIEPAPTRPTGATRTPYGSFAAA